MSLHDAHDERARKPPRDGHALHLGVRAHTRRERFERIPDAARRVDAKSLEQLARRRVARAEDLDTPHAEELAQLEGGRPIFNEDELFL